MGKSQKRLAFGAAMDQISYQFIRLSVNFLSVFLLLPRLSAGRVPRFVSDTRALRLPAATHSPRFVAFALYLRGATELLGCARDPPPGISPRFPSEPERAELIKLVNADTYRVVLEKFLALAVLKQPVCRRRLCFVIPQVCHGRSGLSIMHQRGNSRGVGRWLTLP